MILNAQERDALPVVTTGGKLSPIDSAKRAAQVKNIQKLMNKTFSTIATGQGDGANMKTYGSFEPLNGSYKFNVFGSMGSEEKPYLFNLSLNGSINSDNIGVLFDNSEFSSGTSISGKFHIPLKRANISVMVEDEDRIKQEIARLTQQANARKAMLGTGLDATYISNQIRSEREKLKKLEIQIAEDSKALRRLQYSIDKGVPGNKDYQDSLELSLTIARRYRSLDTLVAYSRYRIDSLGFLSRSKHADDVRYYKGDKIDAALKAKSDSLWSALPVNSQDFRWVSLVGSYGRNKYYAFSEGGYLSAQYHEARNEPFYIGAEYNRFWTTGQFYDYGTGEHKEARRPRIQSLNIGMVWMGGSDIDSYSTTELSTSRKFASGDTTNTLGKKYNVYTDPIETYKAVKFYANYYRFFGKDNAFAFHPFGEVEFRDSDANPFGLGLGIVFSLKNKKDNSVFNIELYGKLKDMGRALVYTEYGMFGRNEIGLNFAVPLNLPKKK
jgi:hypothetical protein